MAGNNEQILMWALGPTPDCMPIDELQHRLEGRAGERERELASSHTAGCPHCRTELALIERFEAAPVFDEERAEVEWIVAGLRKNVLYLATEVQGQRWWKRLLRPVVLAPASLAIAAAVMAIGIALQQPAGVRPGAAAGRTAMRSHAIELVAPIGDQLRPPAMLQWNAVPGASRYRVRVLEVDRTELWNATVSETRVALPEAVSKQALPLKMLLWQVTAINGSGNVLANSRAGAFRVVGGPAR